MLGLTEDNIAITHDTYKRSSYSDLNEVTTRGLAPGELALKLVVLFLSISVASVSFDGLHKGTSHAMVLDTFDVYEDLFIFKNTHVVDGQPKKFTIKRTDPNAPDEFFFVHNR